MSSVMKREILATPALLPKTRAGCEPVCRELAELVRSRGIRQIFLACRGSSENAGVYFRYLCGIDCHLSVTVLDLSVVTLYGSYVDMSGGLLLAVSQGGRGVDIRLVVEEAKRQGVPTAAVTNFPDSPIGALCDYVLPLCVELEESMAATKSFTAELYALWLLDRAIRGGGAAPDPAAAFRKGLAVADAVPAACAFLDGDRPCYVLGRGKLLALAREACCKLQETCLISAFPFSAAAFLHGPFALVERGSRAVVLHSKYACSESTRGMIASLLAQGAEVLAISDDESVAELGCRALLVETDSEDESVFAMTAAVQLLAADLAEIRGTDPDASRNLNKYTETV